VTRSEPRSVIVEISLASCDFGARKLCIVKYRAYSLYFRIIRVEDVRFSIAVAHLRGVCGSGPFPGDEDLVSRLRIGRRGLSRESSILGCRCRS